MRRIVIVFTLNPQTLNPKPCVGDTRVLWVRIPQQQEHKYHSQTQVDADLVGQAQGQAGCHMNQG